MNYSKISSLSFVNPLTLMRRSVSLLLAVALLVSSLPTDVFAAYSDVNGTRFTWAYDHLTSRGMVQGYPDGSGRPTSAINRAEAAKVLLHARQETVDRVNSYRSRPQDTRVFSDVGYGQWYDPYVAAAKDVGMVTGYPDGSFHAENPILVPEAIGMIMRAYGMNANTSGEQWYKPYLDAANERNLLYRGDTFNMNAPISRGQFFDIVYRLEIVLSQNLTAFSDPAELANIPAQPSPSTANTGNPLTVNNDRMEYRQPGASPTPSGTVSDQERQYASTKPFSITIPKLGIKDLTITHPEDALTSQGLLAPLQHGVGHLFSLPGNDGKVLVYGHSSGYAWDVSQYTKIFRRVNELTNGDRVYVTFNGRLFVYEVTGQKTINPTDVTPFMGAGEELILFTCWPPDSIKTRLLVHARPIAVAQL